MFGDAVAWAARTRAFRRAVLEACAAGRTLVDVRSELDSERGRLPDREVDRLGELRLLPVLEAMPSIGGKVASRRLLSTVGLPEDVVLADVDDAAWARLVASAPDTVTP